MSTASRPPYRSSSVLSAIILKCGFIKPLLSLTRQISAAIWILSQSPTFHNLPGVHWPKGSMICTFFTVLTSRLWNITFSIVIISTSLSTPLSSPSFPHNFSAAPWYAPWSYSRNLILMMSQSPFIGTSELHYFIDFAFPIWNSKIWIKLQFSQLF